MRNIIPMELTDLNSSIDMAVRPTYGGLPEYGTASGNIASFETNINWPLKKLEADIEATQDLHGYSHPWVGGSSKSLVQYNKSGQYSGLEINANADGSITVTGTSTRSSAGLTNIGSLCTLPAGSYQLLGNDGDSSVYHTNTQLRLRSYNGSTYSGIKTGDGNFTLSQETQVVFGLYIGSSTEAVNVNYTYYPMVILQSETTDFVPYENICPISGWDEVNVTRTGKNCLIYPYSATTGTYHGVPTTVNSDGTIILNGTSTEQGDITLIGYAGTNINKGWTGSYILTSGVANNDVTINARVRNTSSATNRYITSSNGIAEVTTGENEVINRIYLNVKNAKTFSNVVVYPMLRPSTDINDTYEPYNGQTYTIDLDGTRYGGVLDVTTGVLTVTHQLVDLGTLTWNKYDGTANVFYNNLSAKAYGINNFITSDYIAVDATVANMPDKSMRGHNSQHYIYVKDSTYSTQWTNNDMAGFKSAMSGVQLVYELATPQTVQLTPTEVETVIGQNNIWADSGQVYVEYHFVEDFEE